ncbi:flagellar export protein FliJ [Burkholderia contaminans]|uniref:flagellar export protein FliJ n=1 Tax=Burkholderia cepacia complex TaxID=87882 RepID=UPI0014534BE7|nr:flagellar export protein FliJ [Burkholderia contaminans]VWC74264.1 ATPase involved in DNA repair [Burkholderia contaminans]
MSIERAVGSLARLAELRKRDVDRLGAAFAERQTEHRRHRATLARLQSLADELPEVRRGHPAIAANGGDYKALLLDTIHRQAEQLAAHERAMADSRTALVEAMRRHRSLTAVLERRRSEMAHARDTRSRKREDELATQAWLRQRTDGGRPFHDG